LKQLVDLIAFQVARFGRWCSLRGNRFHPLGFGEHFGVVYGKVTVEGTKRGEPLVSRANLFPRTLWIMLKNSRTRSEDKS
jgi:hypothetical protein